MGAERAAPSPCSRAAPAAAAASTDIDGGRVIEWLCIGAGITGVYWLSSFSPEEREGVLVVEQQAR